MGWVGLGWVDEIFFIVQLTMGGLKKVLNLTDWVDFGESVGCHSPPSPERLKLPKALLDVSMRNVINGKKKC